MQTWRPKQAIWLLVAVDQLLCRENKVQTERVCYVFLRAATSSMRKTKEFESSKKKFYKSASETFLIPVAIRTKILSTQF